MLEHHTTADGRTMLIAQMNDRHLNNTIMLHLRNLQNIKEAATVEVPDDDFHKGMYGIKEVDAKRAGEIGAEVIRCLYPYITEAFLRGKTKDLHLEDIRGHMIKAVGRETGIAPSTMTVDITSKSGMSTLKDHLRSLENDEFQDEDEWFGPE